MRLIISIEAPASNDPASGRTAQYRQNALAALLRDVAARVQLGASEANFERDELFATLRIETDETADAA